MKNVAGAALCFVCVQAAGICVFDGLFENNSATCFVCNELKLAEVDVRVAAMSRNRTRVFCSFSPATAVTAAAGT